MVAEGFYGQIHRYWGSWRDRGPYLSCNGAGACVRGRVLMYLRECRRECRSSESGERVGVTVYYLSPDASDRRRAGVTFPRSHPPALRDRLYESTLRCQFPPFRLRVRSASRAARTACKPAVVLRSGCLCTHAFTGLRFVGGNQRLCLWW